ncbi:MAG: MBL fold metallo-hydrolase, partial [Candidatus Eremiobacteraeota bacterium]|nr:MBL fold metallo-hydrolase [Candidatus Eremiobacteraeota bacterium]
MYSLTILIQGYPGKSDHGGLGWSTVALIRSRKDNVLVDTGHYTHRELVVRRLDELGVGREGVTAVALTHCHWDHCANFALFPKAQIFVGAAELEWAAAQPVGKYPLAEFHVEKLAGAKNVTRLRDGEEFLPGLSALATPGHTPGHMGYVARGERGDLIFTGDAIKNAAELVSQRVDMTLDLSKSLAAIRRVRELAAASEENRIIFGHDRLVSFDGEHVREHEPLRFVLTARLGE